MRKKICFVAQFPPPVHGLSKAVDTLFNSKAAAEFEFEKIDITDNKKIAKNIVAIRKSNSDLFYFTISQTKGGNLRDLAILKAIGDRPCIIHLHGGYYRTLINSLPEWQKKMNYEAIGKLSGAIVLGSSFKWIFEGMLPEEKIFTIPNCVDDEYLMSDEEFEEKMHTLHEQKEKHVLYLSNFIKSKGYPKVLEMAKMEKERGGERRFHFDFAGAFFEKFEEKYFWNYIRENELDNYVTYHGVVSGDKKRELLKECVFFVLLTTYPNEGQPISILEGMGNGMYIITTNHAGIPEIVKKENGIVVDTKRINSMEIYEKMMNVSLEEVIRKNRLKILADYTECSYIKNMGRIFEMI